MAEALTSNTTRAHSEHNSAILDVWEILDLDRILGFIGELPLLTVVAFVYLAFRK